MGKLTFIMCAGLVLTGCANRPVNSPGAGYGADYTPVIDMQGVNPARYNFDLAECRGYARQIDANREAMNGMLAGALLGAALGSIGGNRGLTQAGAQGGALGGVSGAGAVAMARQRQVMINCMAGRGYRALDAAYVMPQASPMPQAQATPAPVVMPVAQEPATSTSGLMPSYLPPGSGRPSQSDPAPLPAADSRIPDGRGCAFDGRGVWRCPTDRTETPSTLVRQVN